jgi:c-di-GMP-binding flagellar brake protein YcgR
MHTIKGDLCYNPLQMNDIIFAYQQYYLNLIIEHKGMQFLSDLILWDSDLKQRQQK